MGEPKVEARYIKKESNPFDSQQDAYSIFVSAEQLKGYSAAEIEKLAKEATPDGYTFVRLNGLEKVPGLERKVGSR